VKWNNAKLGSFVFINMLLNNCLMRNLVKPNELLSYVLYKKIILIISYQHHQNKMHLKTVQFKQYWNITQNYGFLWLVVDEI